MAGDVMAVSAGKTLTVYLAADLKKFNSGMAQAQTGLKGFSNSLKNMLGPAAIGATIALGALATKMAVDGVNAALADEQAVQKLATTLDNLGLAHGTTEVEAFIYQLERSLGVADTELRPAYDRLIRSIGDVGQANEALTLSLDIAAGSGKTLKVVTEALGKAYDGQSEGLSRLGGGIDEVTLRTGNMVEITQMLSDTFEGQAQAAAETLSGRMGVLKTAVDNLAESFGKGLLTGVEEATEGTNDMVKSMEELEPALEDAGEAVADLVGLLAKLYDGFSFLSDLEAKLIKQNGALGQAFKLVTKVLNPFSMGLEIAGMNTDLLTDAAYKASPAMESLGNTAATASGQLNAAADAALSAASAAEFLRGSTYDSGIAAAKAADYERRLAPYLARKAALLDEVATSTRGATSATAAAVEGLTKWEIRAAEVQEILQKQEGLTAAALDNSVTAFRSATEAVKDYASAIQGDLLSGIDLGAAFEGQMDEVGMGTGVHMVDAFNKQIEQAEWFGNVLSSIRKSGADDSLIQAIASLGPETGGALGQQMIDDGLIPTINEKWVGVQETTAALAMGLVPEFMIAGVASGAEMVTGLAQQLQAEQKTLSKLGKNMAKPVGAAFRSRLAKDVAEAVRNVEAAATAARAEKVADATSVQAGITQQAVALAIQNVIRRGDARAGSQVQPVLT